MGIVNVTPDSFSDGGQFADVREAVEHGQRLVEEGADLLDIGGESTRPYSTPVGDEEELERVTPVIQGLAERVEVPLSIDTSKAAVARAAIECGAEIVNDVTGLEGDPEMVAVAREHEVGVCAMHMQGTPQTMQDAPSYQDVVSEVFGYLRQRQVALSDAGISMDRICLDPGIGFGKTHQHNLTLLANCRSFLELGCPILIGHSRKGFIRKMLGDAPEVRVNGSVGVALAVAAQGVHVVRVHDVAAVHQALQMFAACGGIP